MENVASHFDHISAAEVIWGKGEQEFLALVCCHELKGDRESAVSHTADPKQVGSRQHLGNMRLAIRPCGSDEDGSGNRRSEEHTSELQSPCNLVCRLLLEKKKNNRCRRTITDDTARYSSTLSLGNLPRRP